MTDLDLGTDRRPWQPSFEGVVPQAELRDRTSSALVDSVYATLRALDAEQLLTATHAATCQLCIELAHAVTAGVRSGRASAVALAARELREALATLPEPVAPPSDEWRDFVDSLRGDRA